MDELSEEFKTGVYEFFHVLPESALFLLVDLLAKNFYRLKKGVYVQIITVVFLLQVLVDYFDISFEVGSNFSELRHFVQSIELEQT